MNTPPAFLFYPSDFISDENVGLMTNQEIGCYIKLLCYCWREGSIPDDISKIARLCGEKKDVMAQLWLAISPCFNAQENEQGRLVNSRLIKERNKQVERRKERSESGRKGAVTRWYRDNGSANEQPKAKPIAKPIAKNGNFNFNKDIYSELFEVFYEAYPKKKSRQDALKAWLQKRKDIEPNFEAVIAALKKQIPTWTDPKYIPYPATWIRGMRWNDEVDSNPKNSPYMGGWK